jgi:hypothetical protein
MINIHFSNYSKATLTGPFRESTQTTLDVALSGPNLHRLKTWLYIEEIAEPGPRISRRYLRVRKPRTPLHLRGQDEHPRLASESYGLHDTTRSSSS